MARMTDIQGSVLTIRPSRYLYELNNIRSSWDENYLRVHVAVVSKSINVEASIDMLCADLSDLITWLSLIATYGNTAAPSFVRYASSSLKFNHMNLPLRRVDLTAYLAFELCPEEYRNYEDFLYNGYPFTFTLNGSDIVSFTSKLAEEMLAFPMRKMGG